MTILWLIQIIIWANLRVYPFLNIWFTLMEGPTGFLSVFFFGNLFLLNLNRFIALFAFYLQVAVIKGNFKFGIRIPYIFSVHPMTVGGTL